MCKGATTPARTCSHTRAHASISGRMGEPSEPAGAEVVARAGFCHVAAVNLAITCALISTGWLQMTHVTSVGLVHQTHLIIRCSSMQPLVWVCPQLLEPSTHPPTHPQPSHSHPTGPISVCCQAPMSAIRKGNEAMQIH